jgi:acetyl-CoA carboxylase biotin carboxylase subunit
MRIVNDRAELADAVREAASEAAASFADGAVYLERCIDRPRHIEFQILADSTGNVVHLHERECSIQRRHQKIIEETPSPALDDDVRALMGIATVKAARAAGYVNAGTVEFLVDQHKRFYFLEINARLQVEHPVTEMVTGLDLVRLQVEIAAGQRLPFNQSDIASRGHAIECRIYAEDPRAGFAPSPGRISLLKPPSGPGVRHDEGVTSGSDVPTYYDPILAKLITWAEDRPAARARMIRALNDYVILGVKTPIELMIDLLDSAAFRAGETHTGLVASFLERWTPSQDADDLALIAAMAEQLTTSGGSDGARRAQARRRAITDGHRSPWETLGSWDLRKGRGSGR